MMLPNCPSVISVTDETSVVNGKKITLYVVQLQYGKHKWFVCRQFAEFSALLYELKKTHDCSGLHLPSNSLLNKLDARFSSNRCKGLHNFVYEILACESFVQNEYVQRFLEFSHILDILNIQSDESNIVDLGCTENKKASLDNFELIKTIGEGNFGKVYLAVCRKTGEALAIKVLRKEAIKQRKEVDNVMSERNVLVKSFNHPFLCKLRFSFQSKNKLYFVLNYINGGELFYHIQHEKRFPEPRARFYAAQIASALGYLHSQNIIYRDLKPENILIDHQGYAILTDFGLCKQNTDKSTTLTFCGTPEYMAPEVLQKIPYDFSVDWWCLGCVLYEMLHGLPPFYSDNRPEMYRRILEKPLRLRTTISNVVQDILIGLLKKNKAQRLGSRTDFDEVSKHRFFESIDWNKLLNRQLPAPYIPPISSLSDTQNISSEFTSTAVPNSVIYSVERSKNMKSTVDETFSGFSYVPSQ